METSMDERLEQAVATLNELIDRIGACGLRQSVLFLEMAQLQLKLELNGVTDEEFGAFCNALQWVLSRGFIHDFCVCELPEHIRIKQPSPIG